MPATCAGYLCRLRTRPAAEAGTDLSPAEAGALPVPLIGGVAAVGFRLFLLHLVPSAGWLFPEALDARLRRGATIS
jgi:hypothetical protein